MEILLAISSALLALLLVPAIARMHALYNSGPFERDNGFREYLFKKGLVPSPKDTFAFILSDDPKIAARRSKERDRYRAWSRQVSKHRDSALEIDKSDLSVTLWVFLAGQVLLAIIALASITKLTYTQYALVSCVGSLSVIGAGACALTYIHVKTGSMKGSLTWPRAEFSHISANKRSAPVRPASKASVSSARPAKVVQADSREAPEQTSAVRSVKPISQEPRTLPPAPEFVPFLVRDDASQLRAKGMQSFYQNWKNFYLAIGRPSGQSFEATVELIPEPNNRFDQHAVAVICAGWVLGYIPVEHSANIKACILSNGGIVRADAELWFDFRARQPRNSVRLLIATPYRT